MHASVIARRVFHCSGVKGSVGGRGGGGTVVGVGDGDGDGDGGSDIVLLGVLRDWRARGEE